MSVPEAIAVALLALNVAAYAFGWVTTRRLEFWRSMNETARIIDEQDQLLKQEAEALDPLDNSDPDVYWAKDRYNADQADLVARAERFNAALSHPLWKQTPAEASKVITG